MSQRRRRGSTAQMQWLVLRDCLGVRLSRWKPETLWRAWLTMAARLDAAGAIVPGRIQDCRNCLPATHRWQPGHTHCHVPVCPFCFARRAGRRWGRVVRVFRQYPDRLDLVVRVVGFRWRDDGRGELASLQSLRTHLRAARREVLRRWRPYGASFNVTLVPLPDGSWRVRHRQLFAVPTGRELPELQSPTKFVKSRRWRLPPLRTVLRKMAATEVYPKEWLTCDPSRLQLLLQAGGQRLRLAETYGAFRVDQSTTSQAAAAPVDVGELVREFCKRAGCERYSGDGARIELLEYYLLARALTPSLSFSDFLDRFERIADFSDENLKLPADAIKRYLPRAKKQATEQNEAQWTAKQVVEFLTLYVDMIRAAEAQGQEPPLTLNQFLSSAELKGKMLAGEFAVEAPPKRERKKTTTATQPAGQLVAPAGPQPTAAGQRVLYTPPTGPQRRGITTGVDRDEQTGRTYVSYTADDGQAITGMAAEHFTVIDDPPPVPHQDDATGAPLAIVASQQLRLSQDDAHRVQSALSLTMAMGNLLPDAVIYQFRVPMAGTSRVATIEVLNAEYGPYVDAALLDGAISDPTADATLQALPPRKESILGRYDFAMPEGIYRVDVVR